jgi:hypothetical protein
MVKQVGKGDYHISFTLTNTVKASSPYFVYNYKKTM